MKNQFTTLLLANFLLCGTLQAGFSTLAPTKDKKPDLLKPAATSTTKQHAIDDELIMLEQEGDLSVKQTLKPHRTGVVFTTYFTNNTLEEAEGIDFINPIPEDAIYLSNTAAGENCTIMFSIDGGINWDRPENLTITQKDGKTRPATEQDYTHIRWLFETSLAPKAKAEMRFAVRYL